MCGITAVIKHSDLKWARTDLDRMRDEVWYRGPDDSGTCVFHGPAEKSATCDEWNWRVGLAHRRLSILDLTPAGHQPMSYRQRLWIIYNGETYNYVELRRELVRCGHTFRSESDTEVVLAAYAEWGTESFQRLRGMWAMAIYDIERRHVIVCRDRVGIKPLYIWAGQGMVAIASEIKQFRHLPAFSYRADSTSVAEYLNTGYEDPLRTFFADIRPVPAGHWTSIDTDSLTVSDPQPYWHPENTREAHVDTCEAGRAFAAKFDECIALHMRSDVPVGCALSGGLDSTSIVVSADRLTAGDTHLNTFTSTFPGDATDEREYVDAVLAQIRHRPHFDTPSPAGFISDLNRLVWTHDEPPGSASIYASYCLARLARARQVPVLLSGQGGDELFGAYWASYLVYLRGLFHAGRLLPLCMHLGGALWRGGNPHIIGQVPTLLKRYRARRRPVIRVRLRHMPELTRSSEFLSKLLNLDERARRLYEIRTMFLPRLLKWDDRNSMAFSVEGRYPFLDHELIELVLSFSGEILYRNGWTKWPLRYGLRDRLPGRIFQRRTKFGFETPQLKWLQGPLRPEIERWMQTDRPVWQHVLRDDVRLLSARVWANGTQAEESGQELFRTFLYDRWLEVFSVRH